MWLLIEEAKSISWTPNEIVQLTIKILEKKRKKIINNDNGNSKASMIMSKTKTCEETKKENASKVESERNPKANQTIKEQVDKYETEM